MRLKTIIGLAFMGACATVSAQTYRCSSGGQTSLSDRPCSGADTKLQMYGSAAPVQQPYAPHVPSSPKTQDHVKYLGSGCASISEAIRTGPARGVRHDVIRGLYDEYRQKCSVEDEAARRQAQQDSEGQRKAQRDQRENTSADRQRSKERAERCDGMRDVIALKRKREASLNEKEVDALRSLEKTYNELCLAR